MDCLKYVLKNLKDVLKVSKLRDDGYNGEAISDVTEH